MNKKQVDAIRKMYQALNKARRAAKRKGYGAVPDFSGVR